LTTDHKLQWFGTTRPRLGFLATPNLLLTDNIVRVGVNYKWGGGY
jgi:hypothetical protein